MSLLGPSAKFLAPANKRLVIGVLQKVNFVASCSNKVIAQTSSPTSKRVTPAYFA